jgi:5'-phosphate synthase pdxT subunit
MIDNPPTVVTIGVLALQGAFEEHQRALESVSPSITTVQIRTPDQLASIDGIVLPGGESTAMGLIGGATPGLWDALRGFVHGGGGGGGGGGVSNKPTWGTCAGMILLAERCVGTSAVITDGQSLIGGMDVLVCRNYFGSQVSSFEMDTPAPPLPPRGYSPRGSTRGEGRRGGDGDGAPFPGVFIRAPAILTAGADVEVLGRVVAAPCRAAAVVLRELERRIDTGEDVSRVGVVDALERGAGGGVSYVDARLRGGPRDRGEEEEEEEKKDAPARERISVDLPGASDGSNAREVICAVRRGRILCTAFHPEIVDDLRWHEYFVGMVLEAKAERGC